ncbi:MAG: glucose-1-phosphate adenylyltransferase [Clostridiales bacterium]|nr:glucose-1-phosphate adenylyltransferase [Clostridiales bacterium]MDD7392835.1 glucose-1-phosphate adenylyltransferase [Eubacteriales bacterium]
MNTKKECVAMLLAGGQGSRLYTLTEKTAKPAVLFGGKYRIIDFPMSNCVNSGIDTVGVLTQYQPMVLNEYIGNGQPWDLDRLNGGVMVLPPYQGKNGADWYKGTANAIYQNMQFINRYDPDYVLILSGDHIYKMDYAKMLDAHKKSGADCTIAVLNVPLDQASRFGIMNTDETGRIVEFEEKPKHPKSTKASMGIYIFTKKLLEEYLTKDDADPESAKDFGKNVIPAMLNDGRKMVAYPFEGYWKDVGTLTSLWEANMDLLGTNPEFDLHTKDWRIYSRNNNLPPHFISETATVKNSLITEGCDIRGTVINSVLSNGVTVEEGAVVRDSVLMTDVTVKAGARVEYSIIDSDTVICENASVGKERASARGLAVVGEGLVVEAGSVIPDGEMVGSASKNN